MGPVIGLSGLKFHLRAAVQNRPLSNFSLQLSAKGGHPRACAAVITGGSWPITA